LGPRPQNWVRSERALLPPRKRGPTLGFGTPAPKLGEVGGVSEALCSGRASVVWEAFFAAASGRLPYAKAKSRGLASRQTVHREVRRGT